MNEPEAAFAFHHLTRHGSRVDRSRLVEFLPLDPANRPAPFKRYPDLETQPLPVELAMSGVRAVEALSGRAPPRADGLDARLLAALLFFTAGVTRATESPAFEGRTYFRTAMSAGNLHPVEVYVVCAELDGIPAGVHHFAPLEFGLTTLDGGGGAGCTIVLTGIPWRTGWKYGERGYRHLFWDAGTMLANLLAIADAHGLAARVRIGFEDGAWARRLGLDTRTEFPLAIVSIGERQTSAAEGGGAAHAVAPISPEPIEFPLVTATHSAGTLDDVDAWRATGAAVGEPASPPVTPPADPPPFTVEEVILQRGSTRLMRRERAPTELLRWGMAVAARPVPCDWAGSGRTLLEHDLTVHAVEDVEPGAYRWSQGRLEPLHLGDYRAESELLCLRQPLGGDSAFTAFHGADLSTVLGALGTRGYRASQLEAGIASGRLSLGAFALGYGASGLTFFDDAVSQFFATPASCMLVTAVGVPGYRNTAGGGPGEVAELTRYGRLMERLSLQLHRAG